MGKTASTLCNDNFLSFLQGFGSANKFWLAYSGGMDSSVLLHLFYSNKEKIKLQIEVLYVNHGLQSEADDWAVFCQKQCEDYDFPFTELKISDSCPKGESVEAWAREKRYQLIDDIMQPNDVLFSGHHKDDQVETFFLQALRGAGPRGLSAMPLIKKKKDTFYARPLLNYSREEIKQYASEHDLNWQDDKSNSDSRYDRNYFRHKLSPIIESRWPAYRDTINRLIEHQKETRLMLDELAVEDINNAKRDNEFSLDINIIKTLSQARQKNLMFAWLEQLNLQIPGSRHIEKIISDIINSDLEKSPCVNWADVEIRRYKNTLYAFKKMQDYDVDTEFKWQPESILNIFEETLIAKPAKGIGLSQDKVDKNNFIVRFRKGGEKIKPDNASHSKTVKQLFQERSVLPWYRDKFPLVYINDELAAIPGFCVDKKYRAENDEPSWEIHWSGFDKAIQL
jgi:tRNA(Ile)-lysidine synthase